MNVLVTYSSKTGNTKKLAEGIFAELPIQEKIICPISEVNNLESYDIVLVGYWVDKAGPNKEAKEFMERLEGKQVGIFATLAYWPDSQHAWDSLVNGEAMVSDKNTVIGRYICQGKLDEKIIAMFESLPAENPHSVNEEKRARYKVAKQHPSKADIAAGAELFCERLLLHV